jgi:uncharacterized protein (DUF1684 family)
MKSTAEKWTVAVFVCLLSACSPKQEGVDPAAYEAEVFEWRQERLEHLKGPEGYLNLVGLYWLPDGITRIGSDAENDIVFPQSAALSIGELHAGEEGVRIVVADDVDVRYEGQPISEILISDDTTSNPVTLTHGSFAWTVILRDGRFALRLRDLQHPAIAAFPPIESYPIDPAMRLTATMRAYDVPKVVNVGTTIEGLGYNPESPGTLAFEIDGQDFELEAYSSGDSLFFVFGDATSGRETYPAGRFVYTELPDADGKTVLDFNLAYNPPCAFNEFATCPVASPRNRLSVAIEAGEKFDPEVHSTPDGYH